MHPPQVFRDQDAPSLWLPPPSPLRSESSSVSVKRTSSKSQGAAGWEARAGSTGKGQDKQGSEGVHSGERGQQTTPMSPGQDSWSRRREWGRGQGGG